MAIGLVALAVATLALASRCAPITTHVVLFFAALSPYLLLLCGPLSIVFLVRAKRWILAVLASGMTAAGLAAQAPLLIGETSRAEGVAIRVMSANLREGAAEPGNLVGLATTQADVLGLQELTTEAVDRLSKAGIDAAFPYRWLETRDGASGVGIWSRYPVSAKTKIDGYEMAFVSARIRVSGVSLDPTIAVVHLPGPWPQAIDGWRDDIARLPTTLDEVAQNADGGAVIIAGDLNSTPDMRPFREILRNGYRDAAEQSGAGFLYTFPSDWWLPPFLAIDHIVTLSCTATSLRTAGLPGSDHRALLASVVL